MWRLRVPVVTVLMSLLATQALLCAAEVADEVPVGSYHFGGPTGIRRNRPGTWGIVAVDVRNTGDRPGEVLLSMYFAEDPNLQYARRLWVPPRARRYSWCPILPPDSIRADTTRVEVKAVVFDCSGPKEVLLTSPSEVRLRSRLLPVDHSPAVSGVISDSEAPDDAGQQTAFDMVSAARMSAGLSPLLCDMFEDFLPPIAESLSGLDHLVLSNDRLASDAAGLAAVRRWLHDGGRLWVMLDQVDPTTVELLLGNAFRGHVVDRVGLTHVRIKDESPAGSDYGDQPREFDDPVELVRVLAGDVTVHQTVHGWPVSFWQPAGRGRVLFTTLGPHGWVRPRTGSDPRPARRFSAPRCAATEPLEQLSREFFKPRQPPILEPRQFEPYLAEQIGYRIVGRGSVIAVLGTFCLALLAIGIRLARKNQLQRIAWIGPSVAAPATLALVVMGLLTRQTVPSTVAVAQLVEVEPGVDDVQMTGLAAIYNQRACDAPLGVRRGGLFRPDMTGLGGTTRRMVRTDLDAWHWENLTLPAGVRTAAFTYGTKIDHPIEARAAFGPDGLTGTLASGPFEEPADAVVATPWRGNVAVRLNGQGAFSAGAGDVLAPAEFVAGSLLSDEQRRRQSIYHKLLPGGGESTYPDRPVLLAWAKPLDMRFTWFQEARRVGAALLAVPLEMERSPPETRVVVPSPFLDYRRVRGPLGWISSSYSNVQREWLERRAPSETCLRFQIPKEVLPVELDRAALTIEIKALSYRLEIVGWSAGQLVPLASRNGPVGTVRFEIDRAEVLELDDRGGLLLGINVGGRPSSAPSGSSPLMASPAWKIEAVRLEVAGRTLRRTQ